MHSEQITHIVTTFLEKTAIPVTDVSISFDEALNLYWCEITSDESKLLIGKRGETLRAINHLIQKLIHAHKTTEAQQILVDVNGYQKEKIDNLKAVAHMLAERARFFKSSVTADPMNAFERRIVHQYLSTYDDITTESTGSGLDRHIVISYTSTT